MTSRQESALRAVLIGAGTALLVAVGTAAWSSKESASDHNADMSRIEAKLDRVLDGLCSSRAVAERVCK